ncbi:MAG: DUF1573 domain-containing protein [Sphingobacteriales bacterium]|jgi:hypothetical protein|nr:DUF1573 domain-containing protein [Sphingobacteriales bacterium]
MSNNRFQFLMLLVLLGACSQSSNDSVQERVSPDIVSNPASAEGETGNSATPAFTFDEMQFDFGTINSGEKVTHVFSFTNSGTADLIISQVKASCGCTTPSYPENPISPGERGEIKVVFNSEGIAGQIDKDITVLANTTPTTRVLRLTGEVIKVNTKP